MAKTNTTKTDTKNHSDHDHSHDHTHAPQQRHPEIAENKQINFSVPWEKVDQAYQKVLKKFQPHVKTDGFRKGHAPLKIVEQMVGIQRVLQEAAEMVLPEAYVEAVKKADAKPISDPEIHPTSMEMGKDWEFHAHIAEKPEVKLGKYQEVVKKANKAFEEEQKAAEKEREKAAKKTAKDDKKATENSEPETKAPTEQELKDMRLEKILVALREAIKPIIPELLVKQEIQRQLQQLERQMQMYNIEMGSYLKSMGKTQSDLEQEYASRSLASWQLELILDAIVLDQKLEVENSKLEELIKTSYPKPENVTPAQRAQAESMLRRQAVLEYLLSVK